MARPAPRSSAPFQHRDLATISGLSDSQINGLAEGGVLPKRRRGSGNHNPYYDEDGLVGLIANELLCVGLKVASIHGVFAALDAPPSSGKPWAWLRTTEARAEGAALVLVLGHPRGPSPAHVYLTTAAEAVKWIKSKRRTVIVVDVGALIQQLEERTGRRYDDQTDREP